MTGTETESPAGVIAIVPARGGSKGLPGKNVRSLGGHPLIAWSIAAGRAASSVDRVICSTDSEEIAAVAREYGAEVPFLRPPEFATDTATDLDVFGHALQWLAAEEGYRTELVVQLRPTTPFRRTAWIDDAVARMIAEPGISCMRSVVPAPHPPYKMWKIGAEDTLEPLLTIEGVAEPFNMPRQSLPPTYWHTGQIDVIRSATILQGSMTGSCIKALRAEPGSSVDIDTLEDFEFAELVFERRMAPELRELLGTT